MLLKAVAGLRTWLKHMGLEVLHTESKLPRMFRVSLSSRTICLPQMLGAKRWAPGPRFRGAQNCLAPGLGTQVPPS